MIEDVIIEFENNNLINVLENNYGKIFDSMQKEDYIIEYNSFYQFHELIYDGQVVGFFTLDTFLPSNMLLCLNESYIMPKYRGNDILITIIKNYLENEKIRFYIRKPNKGFIKFLLKYSLAYEVEPDIISSHIKFITVGGESYSNRNIKKLYYKLNPESEEFVYYSAAFHMGLCSIFGVDPHTNIVKDNNTLMFYIPRKEDLKKYNLRVKLKKLTVNKIYDIQFDYAIHNDEIKEFNEKLSHELNENNEDILVLMYHDEILVFENLKPNDSIRIDEAVMAEITKGNINFSSYDTRFEYLLYHPDKIDKSVDLKKGEEFLTCPFCGESVGDEKYCKTCGQLFNVSSSESRLKDLYDSLMN